jgi:hypothetical protein
MDPEPSSGNQSKYFLMHYKPGTKRNSGILCVVYGPMIFASGDVGGEFADGEGDPSVISSVGEIMVMVGSGCVGGCAVGVGNANGP